GEHAQRERAPREHVRGRELRLRGPAVALRAASEVARAAEEPRRLAQAPEFRSARRRKTACRGRWVVAARERPLRPCRARWDADSAVELRAVPERAPRPRGTERQAAPPSERRGGPTARAAGGRRPAWPGAPGSPRKP